MKKGAGTKALKFLDRTVICCQHFVLCLSEADYRRALRKLKEPESCKWVAADHMNATAHHFPGNANHRACAIVCIRGWEGREPVAVAGLLVHEAVHIWQSFCEIIGETEPGSEFEAYSIQWIAQQLMWDFQRQTQE